MRLPDEDKEGTSLLVLEDLRRLYDHVNNNWLHLKNRVLTITFGEVAIASFIFTTDFKLKEFTAAESVFFSAGIALLAISFAVMIWILATTHWIIPLDIPESKKLYMNYSSKMEYIEYIKEDYENTIEYCLKKHSIRSKVSNIVLITLTVGIIILLVIKFTRPIGG